MGRETKGRKFLLKIQAADIGRRMKCPPAAPARFRVSLPCGELSLRAWSTAQYLGNFFSGTVAPFRREKTRRRTQGRHAAARCVQKVPRHPDAQRAIPAVVRSHGKMSASGQCFNPGQEARSAGKHLEEGRVRSDMK